VSCLVLESQSASQLSHLLMVVATKHDKQPGALEASFPGLSGTVSRVVDQIKTVVSAFRSRLVATLLEVKLCASVGPRPLPRPEKEAGEAAVVRAEAAVDDWRRLPQSVLPLMRELGRACVLLLPCVQQSSGRSRATLELLPAIASLGAVALDSNIDAVKMVREGRLALATRCC
jgi:hypothetical protein